MKIKRIFDMFLVLVMFPIWVPLMIVLAILVKITSKGSVFFTQKRVGRNRKYFVLYKFRSMYTNTPQDVPTHLLKNPEMFITPFGRFIRKTSLDELPQLLNIIKGELSFVGPRPALWNQDDLINEREKYGANNIPVGLTGLAQIKGRDELSLERKAAYDGEYAKTRSLILDIKILFMTVLVVLRGRGIKEGIQ